MKQPLAMMTALLACLALVTFGQSTSKAIKLTIGQGELVQFQQDITKVVVAEPKIADAIVVGPREVMVTAKGNGKTTLVIWEEGIGPVRYEVQVLLDLTPDEDFGKSIQTDLKKELPDEAIQFNGNAETIVLTGSVKNADNAKRAAAIAQTRTKNVINLIELPKKPDPRQIMLQVKFASIDRAAMSEIGFNYFSRNPKMLGALSTQQFQQPRISALQFQNQEFANTTINFADLLNMFAFRPDLNIGATIRALANQNLMQILAEPNLITVEGKEASFVAGGEFPFPMLNATSTGGAISPVITVQFRPFGVQLNFTPTINDSGAIHLKVRPEVSSLDYSNAITLQGVQIPALVTRRAETEVVLKDGESFAIAGLIDNRVLQTMARIRGLGDIPILGQLFRSRSTKKTTDELVVVITPKFVRPVSPDEKIDLPAMLESFQASSREIKALKDAKGKGKKASGKPQTVGSSGYQEPDKKK
ncbi:MAG: type II and III secretion system protein [Acidobacteria bacterium]|nr:type II and III secretion system protein [Acidobacteriota bacterium]